MQEVFPNLYVGNQTEFDNRPSSFWNGWSIIYAEKFPYHRDTFGHQTSVALKGRGYYLF